LLATASAAERTRAELAIVESTDVPARLFALDSDFTAVYEDDLMSLLTQPLEPGTYSLQATFTSPDGGSCTSERVPFEIVVSRPQGMAQDIEVPAGRIVIAEWHRNADDSALLRQRETDILPLGRFFDLETLRPAQPIRQIAISRNAAYGILDHWRWLAWLVGMKLTAGIALFDGFLFPPTSLPLDLEEPCLLPFGYTTADRGALFIADGKSGAEPCILLVKLLPGDNAEPSVIKLQFEKLPSGIPSATCIWDHNGALELLFSWTVQSSGTSDIIQARVNAVNGEVIATPRTVYTTPRSLQTTAFPPSVAPGEKQFAQMLLAPDASGSFFTHTIFDVTNPSTLASRDLPMLEPFSAEMVDRWVLPSAPSRTTPVLAVAGSDIWASAKPAWRPVATNGDFDASSVRLWAFSPQKLLCSWFDKSRGYRSHALKLSSSATAH
jgi:hypothetical protein